MDQRYYRIGGISIKVKSELPIKDDTFHPKFKLFQVSGNGKEKDVISIEHRFSLPDISKWDLGQELHRRPPWIIYRNETSYVYLGISPGGVVERYYMIVTFNHNHTKGLIYSDREEMFRKGNLHSLTLFPTDQILLARVLADRGGCYMHSSGVNFDGKGLLFVGHSDAGKSTVVTMLQERAEILCDDRIILRKLGGKFRIYGTWSHGDVPKVSSNDVPLEAIFFLVQASENQIKPIQDKEEIIRNILACLVKPLVTADWWNKILSLVGDILVEVPCYYLYFDQSGNVADVIVDGLRSWEGIDDETKSIHR